MHRYTELIIKGKMRLDEIIDFARAMAIDTVAPDRISILFLVQLYTNTVVLRRMNPAKIIREIKALEGDERMSRTKPLQPFKHPPLKGLWHKHYLAEGVGSMARNLQNGLKKDGLPWFEKRIQEAEKTKNETYLTEIDVKALVDDAIHGNWLRRSEANELTGEWIIYAQYEGKNYYLCLGQHDSGDEYLRKQIDDACCLQFPFLTNLLSDAALE